VQDALIEELVEEICDHIYNETVANWWANESNDKLA
jgi:hypothetical protein